MKTAVIITAAGSSERFRTGSDKAQKKEFSTLNGHSVLYYSTLPFVKLDHVQCIVVSYKDSCLEQTKKALEDLIDKKEFFFVKGGATRQNSVANALKKLSEVHPETDFAAIHDGARPFVSDSVIAKTFSLAFEKGAASPCIQVSDTFVLADTQGKIEKPLNRACIRAVQTPQIFSFEKILKAHLLAQEKALNFTDDTQLYMNAGYEVYLSEGELENKKITFPEDLEK